jgi:hypothetical protein
VLKAFMKLDYRRTEALLADSAELRRAIHLKGTPDHATLHRAARRLLTQPRVQRLLARSVGPTPSVDLAAIDSTGFEAGQVSPYFVRRRHRGRNTGKHPLFQTTTYTRFPKLHAVCDCATHLILTVLPMRGPNPDGHRLPDAIRPLAARPPDRLTADAGYDSEANHIHLREQLGIESIIPPRHGRPPKNPNHLPPTKWRRLMKTHFDHAAYGQRWQIETVFSMIKRRLGCTIRERTYHAQCRAMRLLAFTHNCMILLRCPSFATEQDRGHKTRQVCSVEELAHRNRIMQLWVSASRRMARFCAW